MIFDRLEIQNRYASVGANIAAGLAFLQRRNFIMETVHRIDLDGDALYVLIQEFDSKPAEQGVWEAHRRYIDIHYLVSGRERILYAPLSRMTIGDYVPEKDFLPLTGAGMALDLVPGDFAIFFPGEPHMPGLAAEQAGVVKKVVVKILER